MLSRKIRIANEMGRILTAPPPTFTYLGGAIRNYSANTHLFANTTTGISNPSKRIIIFASGVAASNASPITSINVTLGGANVTSINTQTGQLWSTISWLPFTGNTNQDIVFNFNANVNFIAYGRALTYGLLYTSPYDKKVDSRSNAAAISTTVKSPPGSFSISTASRFSANVATVTAGNTGFTLQNDVATSPNRGAATFGFDIIPDGLPSTTTVQIGWGFGGTGDAIINTASFR